MDAQGDSLVEAVPVPKISAMPPAKSGLPVWDAEQLRLAIAAAGVALWSWNVDTNRFTMDERAFHLWGVPLSGTVTFDDLSSHIHPADREVMAVRPDAMASRFFTRWLISPASNS